MELPVLLMQKDIDILRLMVKEYRRRQGVSGTKNPPVLTAPETYLAKAPPEGIDGRTEADPPVAGYAECELYRINNDNEIVPIELAGDPITQGIYNISRGAVAGDAFILVTRDKYGSWVVVVEDCGEETGTGSGTS